MLSRPLTLALIIGTLCACTKGVPEVTALSTNTWLALDKSVLTYTTPADIQITGTCNPNDQEIDYSLDNGATWSNITQGSVSASFACSATQTFSVNLNISANPAAAWSGTPTGLYHILFRAKILGSLSNSLNLVLNPMTSSSYLTVSDSSSRQSVSGYQVKMRVVNSSSAQSASGYSVQVGVTQ